MNKEWSELSEHMQQYCVLIYSEKKENYLQNIGYLGSS